MRVRGGRHPMTRDVPVADFGHPAVVGGLEFLGYEG